MVKIVSTQYIPDDQRTPEMYAGWDLVPWDEAEQSALESYERKNQQQQKEAKKNKEQARPQGRKLA